MTNDNEDNGNGNGKKKKKTRINNKFANIHESRKQKSSRILTKRSSFNANICYLNRSITHTFFFGFIFVNRNRRKKYFKVEIDFFNLIKTKDADDVFFFLFHFLLVCLHWLFQNQSLVSQMTNSNESATQEMDKVKNKIRCKLNFQCEIC